MAGWWSYLGYADQTEVDETTALPCQKGWKLVVSVTSNKDAWPSRKVQGRVLEGFNRIRLTSSTETGDSLVEVYEGKGNHSFQVDARIDRANWKLVASKGIQVSNRPEPYRVDLVITTGNDIRFEVVDNLTRKFVSDVAVQATLPVNDQRNAATENSVIRFVTDNQGTCTLDRLDHDIVYQVTDFRQKGE